MLGSFYLPLVKLAIWWAIIGFISPNYDQGVAASTCRGTNAWYYDGGQLLETNDLCIPFTKHCYVGRNQGRYWQNYTKDILTLDILSTQSSILQLNASIITSSSSSSLDNADGVSSSQLNKLYISLLKYWSQERVWNQTLAQVKFEIKSAFQEIQFCVKQYPTSSRITLCDFKGIVPTRANELHSGLHDLTFITKFDVYSTTIYVFVYSGKIKISNFFIQIDTASVQHYKGNFAFKIDRSQIPHHTIPANRLYFNSVFHTEESESKDNTKTELTFEKLWPEMICPVKNETYCELSKTCINESVPCQDKTANILILKNIHDHVIINFEHIDVNNVQKITIVLNGRNGILYPVVGPRSGTFLDLLNVSTEFNQEEDSLDNHHLIGIFNNGPRVSFNATIKCTVFSVIIVFSSNPNEWCLSGNQPKIYIAKDKQIVLLGHMISNPKFWRSIDVLGIKDVIRVKIEKWNQETSGDFIRNRGYPVNCNEQHFISPINLSILTLVVLFAIVGTGILSNYFHRYSIVRTSYPETERDFPGAEMENDIEFNVLRGKESYRHTVCQRTFSPIHFESKSVKLPIEKENILDVSNNEEFEGVKVVNNIVYLED